jgi:bifunctional DNase/RNase
MKYLIILILFLNISLSAKDLRLYKYEDKQLHLGATYVISSVTTAYVFKKTQDKKRAMWIGFGVGMGVGIAKELYDIEHGNPETGDLIADVVGSALGSFVITIPLP